MEYVVFIIAGEEFVPFLHHSCGWLEVRECGLEGCRAISSTLMDEKLLSEGRDRAKGKYAVVHNEENPQLGLFDKPLPFCGCGIGWFSFLLGFVFPVMWYFAMVLYFCNYYQRDPRERSGLAACAIAAMMCTIGLGIALLFLLF